MASQLEKAPIISDSLKAQFSGAVPEMTIIDGRERGQGLVYRMVPVAFDAAFPNGIPSVDSPDFASHLTPEERAKRVRRANSFGGVFRRAVEASTAAADARAYLDQERVRKELAGEPVDETTFRRQVSTLVPYAQSEAIIGDPVRRFAEFQTTPKRDDTKYVGRAVDGAIKTITKGINVKPSSLVMDGLSFLSGWLTLPIDAPRAANSLRKHNRRANPEAALMYTTTALIDLWPHPTPGISSSHARWATNVHRLLDQAIVTSNMHDRIVKNQPPVQGQVDRYDLYRYIANSTLDRKGQPGAFGPSELQSMHKGMMSEANAMRREMGQYRRAQRKEILSPSEIEAYTRHIAGLERDQAPQAQLKLLIYTMGTQMEEVLDTFNSQRPQEQRVTYK
ncbi:MAG TPA: hypothetical protein VFQ63_03230 [Patescibacteria group bacterium]|nr:hypothetical protein [Patescibacteria group bacterium]